jgi:hypothetical protein
MDWLLQNPSRTSLYGRRIACVAGSQGSVLLLTVIVLCLLSVLFLLATDSVLLGTKARQSLQDSFEMFYIAEAGLSHGQAFCLDGGETWFVSPEEPEADEDATKPEVDHPFGLWLPFGRGRYQVEAYQLGLDEQPFVNRDSGILLVSTAQLKGTGQRRVCLLMDQPPSCSVLAWWEPN